MERDGAVLVQGPPGTGKTHTIANMIGHLLAQGKTVLVTSHTAKALTVLREQVVKPLQPLCVSVLDDSRTQVAAAVDAITERLAASDVDSLEREAAGLRRERAALLGRLRNARAKLLEARQDEYRPIVIAGDEIHPSQAARRVADARASASWIPAPVTMGEPLPLSPGEVAELYRTNAEVSAADEVQLTKKLPAPDDLVTPGTFARCVSERAELEVADQSDPLSKLWRGEPTAQDEDSLRLLRQRLEQASEPLRAGEKWQLAAIAAGHTGGGHRQAWEDLIAEIESTYKAAAEAQPLILSALPAMAPGYDLDRAVRILEDIATYVAAGGKLNWLKLATKPDWRTITDTAQVRGTHPERLDDFRALLALARREKARQTLVGRWHYQMSALGAPPVEALGAEPEEICRQFVSPLRTCLAWYQDQWEPLQRELVARGLKWETVLAEVPPQLDTYGELLRLREAALTRLPPIVAARIRQVRLVQIDEQLNQLRASLMRFGSGANAAEVVVSLRAAVNAYNAVEYQDAFERLVDLHTRTKALETRRTLLGRLERTAPAWAAAVRGRLGIHGQSAPPGDVAEAWEWRQLHDELDQRSKTSLETLQNSIADLTAELHETTAKLVEKTAWAAQVRRTTLEQRQALQGWKQLIRKAGRGTGIRAPRLLAEARALMPVCQTAVPVWIMPLSRVVDNFDVGRNRFDVVIIDEASQADTMALIAVYMARQVVVVGDDEQVSPLAVGQKQAEVQRIIDEHLVGVPQHQLYDGQYSIYELGQTSFEPVCLLEHFRCVMPIIQFSNYLSYGGKIKPLRDASMVRRVPHTVAYRVQQAGATTGNVNEVEAVTIASLLVAATEQPEYAGASFGVISLVGDEQAMRVDSLLRNHLPPVEYQGRRIQCGNSAQFQGDERDVIFLSMVDTSVDGAPLALRTEGPFNLYKKRFNVAASRARDQMWVVYSLDPETHLKPGDLRRRLIQHAQDPMAASLTLERQEQRTESEFERLVLRRLVAAGYKVVPQWSVGAYRIDMVVEGGGKRLAVECDGDRWHPHSKLEEDMARQAILERLGWRFVRIRGSQFFQDADAAMKPVFARLQELEVTPDGNVGSSDVDTVGHDLRERVIRRASELRAEWETPSDAWLALDSDEDHSNFSEDNLGSAVQVGPGAANGPSSLAQTASAITPEPRVSTSPSRSDVSSRATSDQRSTSDEARSNLPTTIPGENRPEASRSPQKSTPNRSQSVAANIARAEQVVNRTNREQTAPTSMSLSDAIGFLRSRGLQLIDNRAKGGALWVIGGPALSVVFDELKQRGVRFAFARAGSKATGHRPAWFLETGRQ